MSKKDTRARQWTFILYPESAPVDWKQELKKEHIPYVISPLHDKDLDENKKPKKSHYHVLVTFEGKKSYDQILELTTKLGATIPQRCASAKGLVRYMLHLDNPEKHQYSMCEIESAGGIDVSDLILTPSYFQRASILKEMSEFVLERDITELEDLHTYAMKHRFNDWFQALTAGGVFVMDKFISSRRYREQKHKR